MTYVFWLLFKMMTTSHFRSKPEVVKQLLAPYSTRNTALVNKLKTEDPKYTYSTR